jgi:hypothetical protein
MGICGVIPIFADTTTLVKCWFVSIIVLYFFLSLSIYIYIIMCFQIYIYIYIVLYLYLYLWFPSYPPKDWCVWSCGTEHHKSTPGKRQSFGTAPAQGRGEGTLWNMLQFNESYADAQLLFIFVIYNKYTHNVFIYIHKIYIYTHHCMYVFQTTIASLMDSVQ